MKVSKLNQIFVQPLKEYLTRFQDKKLTCLIFGGLGNQLTMASIAEIYSKEKGIKNIDFEYIKPRIGALRNCSLENYFFSKDYKIKYANLFLQKIYRTLVKLMILKKDIILWEGMKLSIFYIPFKMQIEINEIEFNILNHKKYKNRIFKSTSLINNKLSYLEKKNVVIHFRDYLEELGNQGYKYQLKESYFFNALKILKIPIGSSIDIVCYKKPFKKFPKLSLLYKLNYLTSKFFTVEQSLEIMRNSKIFIMSNSTLSWWGGYGSIMDSGRKVVFPVKDTEGLINWKQSYKLKDWIPCYE